MPAAGALFALLFVGAIVGTLALWVAIDGETDDAPQMSRSDAERVARQDTHDAGEDDGHGAGARNDRDGDEETAEWGTDAGWGDDADDRR